MNEQARRWVIHGRVQGVSFRWYTRRQASSLGVSGWVRNLDDGTVEVLARGSASALDDFAERLSNGPRWARVDRLEEESLPEGEIAGSGFEIRH